MVCQQNGIAGANGADRRGTFGPNSAESTPPSAKTLVFPKHVCNDAITLDVDACQDRGCDTGRFPHQGFGFAS